MRGCPPGHVPLERALSKLGLCSRSQARALIAAGRVQVRGAVQHDPLLPVRPEDGTIALDQAPAAPVAKRYCMLNKPRGLVTTTSDEQGRETVYRCFTGSGLPWLAPVGRLDRASEGLLLFTNDTRWAEAVLDPARGPGKTYHVQLDGLADEALLEALRRGTDCDGEHLAVSACEILRHGSRSSWLGIELHEGRNRHIRRLLQAHGIGVRRLVRVAIGPLALGELAKGAWRELEPHEIAAVATA